MLVSGGAWSQHLTVGNHAPPSPLRSLTCVLAPRAQLLSDRNDASVDAVRRTESVDRMI